MSIQKIWTMHATITKALKWCTSVSLYDPEPCEDSPVFKKTTMPALAKAMGELHGPSSARRGGQQILALVYCDAAAAPLVRGRKPFQPFPFMFQATRPPS